MQHQAGGALEVQPDANSRRSDKSVPMMLAALVFVFILSHAFRTVSGIAAEPLAVEFNASVEALGAIAGSFHLAFALAQPAVGLSLDRYGPRTTVLVAFVVALIGGIVSATAHRVDMLILGQCLLGIGCAPALLAAMVLVSRRYPPERFAYLSGIILATGGVGMLMTGTPLAWVIDIWSWRFGFGVLTVMAALSWIAVFWLLEKEPSQSDAQKLSIGVELRGLGTVIVQPHTLGICCLGAVTYAAFMALRGLWIGPLLTDRYGFSLIEVGHVALAVSIAVILGPYLFGRIDPGPSRRRKIIVWFSAAYAVQFAVLALGQGAEFDTALAIFIGLSGGYVTMQYADVRSSYPAEMTGRALSVFTMAMFGGVAAMQWLSGIAGTLALDHGIEATHAALLFVSATIAASTLAFWRLPQPPVEMNG
ncbi:MAG: MFS transporter [Rhodospirillales bacterium]